MKIGEIWYDLRRHALITIESEVVNGVFECKTERLTEDNCIIEPVTEHLHYSYFCSINCVYPSNYFITQKIIEAVKGVTG